MEQMTVADLTAWLAALGRAHGWRLPVSFQLDGTRYALVTVEPLGNYRGNALVLGHSFLKPPRSISEVLGGVHLLIMQPQAPVWLHATHTLAPLLDGLWMRQEQIPLLADVQLTPLRESHT